MKRVAIALFTSVLAVVMAACAPTATTRATGEVIDDATLVARVKTKIAQTQGLGDALKINVNAYRGVIELAGFVDNADQVRAAGSAAREVGGVREVRNALQVKPR